MVKIKGWRVNPDLGRHNGESWIYEVRSWWEERIGKGKAEYHGIELVSLTLNKSSWTKLILTVFTSDDIYHYERTIVAEKVFNSYEKAKKHAITYMKKHPNGVLKVK